MKTKGIDLTQCRGFCFKASIGGLTCEGKIQVENGLIYLCQNKQPGWDCEDKIGFKYSWTIGDGSEDDLRRNGVSDFEIVPRDPETYRDWQVGDAAKNPEAVCYIGRVIFVSGDFVVIETDGHCVCYTREELFNEGYRLVLTEIEKQIIEEKKWTPQDGDICYLKGAHGVEWIFIKDGRECKTSSYIRIVLDPGHDCLDTVIVKQENFIKELRPATEEEKQRLFDAMAKEGKRWNAEKKVVEDIPKPREFKKGDPVLVRIGLDNWRIAVFSKKRDFVGDFEVVYGTGCGYYDDCIPYNEKTMHLLGTTEDYKEE